MLIDDAADLILTDLGPIELSRGLLERLSTTRYAALAALTAGGPVYGVNTGMGALSKVRLTDAEQRVHQRNLLQARAAGGEPWLSPTEARVVVLARLRTFLTGDAAVSPELCLQLVALLNSGLVPAIPAGGAGSAGEIIPLAHAFGPLVGIGSFLHEAGTKTARGVLPPFELGPKEGIALLAGIPGATGRAWLQTELAGRLAGRLSLIAAGAITVVGANRDPYNPLSGRGDELLAAELKLILQLAGPEADPRALQAPVSFRVAGHVISHLKRSITRLDEAVQRAFTGVNDSPAFLDGEFVGTAGFHGIDLAAHCDQLVAALAHAAEVSTARIHRLLDPSVTGLPAQLTAAPGPQAGLVTVHKRAVATSHYLRRLALPSAIGALESSNGQEDVQSFSWEAVGVLAEAIRLTREVAACELLTVYQAFALAQRPVPAGLQKLFGEIANVVPPIIEDRPYGVDLAALLEHVV